MTTIIELCDDSKLLPLWNELIDFSSNPATKFGTGSFRFRYWLPSWRW